MVAQFINGALVANPVRLLLVASITLLLGATTPSLLPHGGDMTGQPVQDEVVAATVLVNDDNDEHGDGESATYRPVSSHDNNGSSIETNDSFKRVAYENMDMA
jgi:hypothetical protein